MIIENSSYVFFRSLEKNEKRVWIYKMQNE